MKSGKKWLGITALIPAVAISFMDQSIMPIALPSIQKELHATDSQLHWCINAYLLAIALFVLMGGKISDRIGHLRAFICGTAIFTLASALCGLSPTPYLLILSRFLQGVGSAMIFPSQAALISVLFPPHENERGRASGFIVSIGAIFMILGPLIGGILVQELSWRYIFWINIPIAALGVILSLIFLPSPAPRENRLNGWGFIVFVSAITSLTVYLMQVQMWGVFSTQSLTLLLVCIGSFLILFRREKISAHPFLDLTLFQDPVYASIVINIAITQFVLMVAVFRTLYFHEVLNFSPSKIGLLTFFSSMPVIFCSPISGYLSDRFNPKLPIRMGYCLLIGSCLLLGFCCLPSYGTLLVALTSFSIGIPFVLTPSYSTAMSVISAEKQGIGYGTISSIRMVAGTIGVAVIGGLASCIQSLFVSSMSKSEGVTLSFSSIHFILALMLSAAFIYSSCLYEKVKRVPNFIKLDQRRD